MQNRFRWTFLLTLVVASLVVAPLAVTAADLGSGNNTLQLRGERSRGSNDSAAGAANSLIMYERSFAPVMEGLGVIDARSRSMVGGHYIATPSGYVNINRLVAGEYPLHFSSSLVDSITATDVALAVFGDASMETIREAVQMAGVRTLGSVPNSGIVVTGVTDSGMATLTRFGAQLFLWAPGNFMSPEVGVSPVPNPDMALDTKLNMVASVFPGEDVQVVIDALTGIGATVQSQYNGLISYQVEIDALRNNLGLLGGLPIRAMSELGFVISADEDGAATMQIAEWRNGARPYTDAGVDGSTQVVGITDTGLSLDAAVLGSGVIGDPAGGAGLGHRKVVAYVTAASVAGGGGDLLTCDGSTGATHGHLVASLIAGNASDVVPDVRFLSGFETNIAGTQTLHGIDGQAPGARVYFVDDATVAQCANPFQIEAQIPGTLSANAGAAKTFGTANGLDLSIHNFSFSIVGSEASYDLAAQDIDTWLHNNQDFLVMAAAGNEGVDSLGDGNLDFGTVTSPGTAKNVVTVSASGTVNNPLDLSTARLPQVPNNGHEIIARWANSNGGGQGPAAFTVDAFGATNWRIKPDVMANGDETLGADNQRLTSPTTCISADDDNTGAIECARLLPGIFDGTSFATANASGVAAMVRDYFSKGYAPAGQAGGSSYDLMGPELKAALIASGDLMTGNPQWRQIGQQLQTGFYNPRHLSTFTPEQGYGRLQVDKLLPLASQPGTPSYIQSQMLSVPYLGTTSQTFTVVNSDEPLRCVASWYDLESTLAGPGEQGKLVRDVNMTMWDCGPDGVCANSDDTRYQGNYFTEDANYDGVLLDLSELFACSNDTNISCDPGDFNPAEDCLDGTATCVSIQPAVTEDCNQNGALDFSEYSLPVPPAGFVRGAPPAGECATAGLDSNNNNEAVFLAADQLTQARTMRVDLDFVSTSNVGDTSVDVALVCTGGLSVPGSPNSIRANKAEFSCSDVMELSVVDGGQNATVPSVVIGVTVVSKDALGSVVDIEEGIVFSETATNTRYLSVPVAIVDGTAVPPANNDSIVGVFDGGSVELTYEDAPTADALGSATVRCQPSLAINNIARRGTNANFNLTGGCDPRGRIDPRFIAFGAVIGTGTMVSGDLFLDKNEDLVYTVNFTNQEEGDALLDVTATLTACTPGTVLPDGSCTPFPGIEVYDGTQNLGLMTAGLTQSASFNLNVKPTVTFPGQVEMVFGVSAQKNGLTVANINTFHHVLDADTWSFADEDPAVSGATYYSTDFPTGGREVKVYAQEFYDPLNWMFAAETFKFGDMTSSADCADANPNPIILCGNANLMGFNPGTGRFDTPIANTMPWTFDTEDEGFAQRRRFDSDPGDNLELQSHNVWQWNNTGECGFQSNDRATGTDGQTYLGGTGGVWHSGFAESMPGTPGGRTGYDLGCENYDIPGSPDPKREVVIDAVSSPHFFRVKQQTDANGFAYQLEFTRYGFNIAPDVPDGNAMFGYELDPDTTTSQPSDPVDYGWLNSDQGTSGFLSGVTQASYQAFNPNNPHELGSGLQSEGFLDETVGSPTQNILEIHGDGSNGSWYDPNNPNKLGAGFRTLNDEFGVLTSRGWNYLGATAVRGSAGLPVRNWDESWEIGAGSFEDIFGPNETRTPDQTYPITPANPEVLINRRDSFQTNMTAVLRENADPSVATLSGYGIAFDDVVVEWREQHPVADRTPCTNPLTWAQNATTGVYEGVPTPPSNALAAGCASISWDRNTVQVPELAVELTVIDQNAQYGPDRLAGTGDEQAVDTNADGFAEVTVPVASDADISGETFTLTQIALASPVYKGVVKLSATKGLTSGTDGVIFIQQNGDGTAPVFISTQYNDQDINASGVFADYHPCPDNPLIDTMQTSFVGDDVLFVTAKVTDSGANADFDNIADPGETVSMDISVVNSTLDINREKPDLEDITITLVASVTSVGPNQPIACILDGSSYYGTLLSGIARFNDPGDPFKWVVGNANRTSASQVLQAVFSLGISGRYTDSLGIEKLVSSFRTPQKFAINIDLDIDPNFPAASLTGDSACVGGTNAGQVCTVPGDCPGGTCDPLPAYLQTGGTGFVAGDVGYFEGFEGATNLGGRNLTGGPYPQAIPGTSFVHSPGVNTAGGYLDGNTNVSFLPGPLSPGAAPGNSPDDPEGSSAVDGIRCQYNDPKGPSKHPRSEPACRPWNGSGWAASGNKAFSGTMALYNGIDGDVELGIDNSFDANWLQTLESAFTGSMNVGVAGNATLSVYHIVQSADDRTFNVPAGNAVGRGWIEWAEVDATGKPINGWVKLNGFQNNYGNTGVTPFFGNCVFEHYDEFYDASAALGTTPGFDPGATSGVGVAYNSDNIGSEDDYFDPNDPQRLFGASSSCFPAFVYSSLGDYTSTNIANAGKAFTAGELGSLGNGVWVNSLFNLDTAGGKRIRIRFTFSDLELALGFTWADFFGNSVGNGVRGWRMDDVAVSGLVDAPLVLIPDPRTPGANDCPIDPSPGIPGNQAACNVVVADAGADVLTPVSGATVTLDASASTFDQCVDGFLEYRWRIGGTTIQEYATNPVLVDAPQFTTVYTVDARCSTDPTCLGSDSVAVVPADESEVSGTPVSLGTVEHGVSPGAAITTWTEPQVGGPFVLDVLGFDLQRAGSALRTAGGQLATAAQLSAAVRADACGMPGSATPIGGGQFVYTDTLYSLAVDELVGYLSISTSSSTGIVGSMGRGEMIGAAAQFGRGRVSPTTVPPCP